MGESNCLPGPTTTERIHEGGVEGELGHVVEVDSLGRDMLTLVGGGGGYVSFGRQSCHTDKSVHVCVCACVWCEHVVLLMCAHHNATDSPPCPDPLLSASNCNCEGLPLLWPCTVPAWNSSTYISGTCTEAYHPQVHFARLATKTYNTSAFTYFWVINIIIQSDLVKSALVSSAFPR